MRVTHHFSTPNAYHLKLKKPETLHMTTKENSADERVVSSTIALISANVVAAAIYLIAASVGWVEPEVADVPGAAGGGAVVWFLFAVPVFLLSFLGNLSCLVLTTIHRYRKGQWRFFWWSWFAVLALWCMAVAFDFTRHGT